MKPKIALRLIKDSAKAWSEDKASRLAASLSYYTIFSIAPLLVISIAIAGLAFGQEAASNQIFREIQGLIGEQGAKSIQEMVANAHQMGGGITATVIGLGALLLGASGAFGQLQDALNTIWEVQPKPGQGVWGFLRNRFLSFSMVLVIGFMLLVTLVVSAALAGFGGFLDRVLHVPEILLHGVNFLISFAVTSMLFTLIYKVLPDVRIRWKDVIIGGVATALLFSLGRFLIGLYLGHSSVSSAYGAAGSLVVVLLWIYYSSQILLFGAEFTKVYADAFGGLIQPSPHAEPMAAETRIQQGMPAPSAPSPAVSVKSEGAGRRRHPGKGLPASGGSGSSGGRKRSGGKVLPALMAGALGFFGVRRFALSIGLWFLSRLLRRSRHA